MAQNKRGSEWLSLRRSLVILRRLLQGPATTAQLLEAVVETLGREAYPGGEKARRAAFKRDRENLRRHLQVEFYYDSREGIYLLNDPGLFGYLDLSLPALRAVGLLWQAFAGQMGERAEVQALLEELVARLAPEARRELENRNLFIDLDLFQGVDTAPIAGRVWETVQRAVQGRRQLCFNYISPQHEDRLPRYHKVAPYQLQFRRGHWYLYAFDLYARDPAGQERYETGHVRFRLQYILDDEQLQALPARLPEAQHRPPRYLVHYRLLHGLGRGAISRHFQDMEVQRFPDGSAEVRGFTEDDWEAARILLGYGENCVVLGGEQVLRRVRRAVDGMARNYGIDDE